VDPEAFVRRFIAGHPAYYPSPDGTEKRHLGDGTWRTGGYPEPDRNTAMNARERLAHIRKLGAGHLREAARARASSTPEFPRKDCSLINPRIPEEVNR